jgi:esterase/lipase superfamily enzyme
VILAAPDVDARIFRREILPRLRTHAQHITLYASSDDDALRASRVVNNTGRLGLGGDSIVVLDGMDTIDATRVSADILGHTLFGNPGFLTDLAILLADGKSPAERRLLPATKDGKTFYRFRGDRR